MNYSKVKNLLFDLVLADDELIPKEFYNHNKDYLMRCVDKNLNNYCNVMFKKDAKGLKKCFIALASFMAFIVIKKAFFSGILITDYRIWIMYFLIWTNLNFIISESLAGLAHDVHVKSNYKIKKSIKLKNRFGFYLAYVGMISDDENCNVLKVVSLDKLKNNKKVTLYSPKVYLVNNLNLSSIVINYLYENGKKDLNWLKSEIFLDVRTEYLNHVAREQAIDYLMEREKEEE